jgi:hypothetical protein
MSFTSGLQSRRAVLVEENGGYGEGKNSQGDPVTPRRATPDPAARQQGMKMAGAELDAKRDPSPPGFPSPGHRNLDGNVSKSKRFWIHDLGLEWPVGGVRIRFSRR